MRPRGPTRRPAKLLPIRDVAAQFGWSAWNTRRILKRLAQQDGAAGTWLVRQGYVWLVNLSALRAAHAELFEALAPPSDLEADVETLKTDVAEIKKRQRIHGAALKALAAAMKSV